MSYVLGIITGFIVTIAMVFSSKISWGNKYDCPKFIWEPGTYVTIKNGCPIENGKVSK